MVKMPARVVLTKTYLAFRVGADNIPNFINLYLFMAGYLLARVNCSSERISLPAEAGLQGSSIALTLSLEVMTQLVEKTPVCI
jgi:hypothetical protein